MIYSFLFPTKSNTTKVSVLLLAVRIIVVILLMNHGIQKWSNFQEMSAVFPDPLGIGSPLSLGSVSYTHLAQKLYHEHAAKMPIIDYHCHLIPQMVADDYKFKSLTEIWLGGDQIGRASCRERV